jgi:hypothetical protein
MDANTKRIGRKPSTGPEKVRDPTRHSFQILFLNNVRCVRRIREVHLSRSISGRR